MLLFRFPLAQWAAFIAFPVLFFVLWLWRLGEASPMMGFFVPFMIAWALVPLWARFMSVLQIGPDGLVLYRVNRLVWSDVVSVRQRRFLGLSHLVLHRRRGGAWWVPLYFHGPLPVSDALRDAAPEGNPIRDALTKG